MADELKISFGTCQALLMHHLGIKHVLAKLVPRLLTQSQTTACHQKLPLSCQALLQGMR
jgi:hypothetical protein